ncbi:unnamed protein product [Schistosoma turkestanicum]|nr:unnamed protein product [Schistosoma turkestanicum]
MESTEVIHCSENPIVQENNITTITTTTTTFTTSTTNATIPADNQTNDIHDDNSSEAFIKSSNEPNVHSHEMIHLESKRHNNNEVSDYLQNHDKTNEIVNNETMNPHSDTINSEMKLDASTENTHVNDRSNNETHVETTGQQCLKLNNLAEKIPNDHTEEANSCGPVQLELSVTEKSPDLSIHEVTSNNSSISQSAGHHVTSEEEEQSPVNHANEDDDTHNAKHPYRPPPPKLDHTKHTSASLSNSGGENEDVMKIGDKQNGKSQVAATSNTDHNHDTDHHETNPKTSSVQQQQQQPEKMDDDHESQHSHHKHSTIKSNIKHAFSNLRKSFKRKDKPSSSSSVSVKRVVDQPENNVDRYQYTSQQSMKTQTQHNYNDRNIDQRNKQPTSPVHHHDQYYRDSDVVRDDQSQISNAQSLNISSTDSLQHFNKPEEIDLVYTTEIIAPPAIPTKMSSDPNSHIYVNHSIKPNRPPTIFKKDSDAKEFAAAAIVDNMVSHQETYWKDELNHHNLTSQPSDMNYRQYYVTKSEHSTPKLSTRSQSCSANNHHGQKPYLTPDLRYTHHQLTLPKPKRPTDPPLLSPLDHHHHQEQDKFVAKTNISARRLDLVNSINPNNKFFDYDHHEHSNDSVGYYNTEYSDYPIRPHVYQPTHQAATLSYNEFDHYDNGTLKPRKPKIIAERYKCSEVYQWPPKFPKLKRRKTNPPKQIHTAQDHIVIKQQLKTTAGNNYSPVNQQTESKAEQIHCIKVNNQYHSPKPTRELSVSPERQVTSLHSLQRSTLLEKSNRTSGTESRDQLFIADYKLTPNNQVGSMKPGALALPYFAKITENKRFSKFHQNTSNNTHDNDNNIAVSAEVMRSDSSKSSTVLKDALKTMHPLLQNVQGDDVLPSAGDSDDSKHSKLLITCLSEYLFTCMKLRSLDLQGEYATFVFPLKNFDEKSWNHYGIIDNWNDLSVVCAPNTNYEYVVLNITNESGHTIKFPTKTTDKLLTSWLDNQTTKTPSSDNPRHSLENKNNKEKISNNKLLHSISLAVTLKTLLNVFEKHDEKQPDNEQSQCEDLFLTCIKLSILLSLSECLDKHQTAQFDLNPENILLILSPSNCLTIFKSLEKIPNSPKNEKPTNNIDNDKLELKENNLHSLLNSLHIEHDSIHESLNDLLKHLHEIIQHRLKFPDMITSLLKSVAPPDWITICVARICLYNQTN